MKTDVDTALKDIADFYVKNRRGMTEPELGAILKKHCESEAETKKFVSFLDTEPGQLRFKTLLREREQTTFVRKPSEPRDMGERWNMMTPAEREELGIKAGLSAEARGARWIGLWPEQKRAIIRAWKKEEKPSYLKETKEPWQMTLEEYAYEEAHRYGHGKPRIDWIKAGYGETYRSHKTAVQRALKESKPVPAEVLKDYPELTKLITKAEPHIPEARVRELKHHEELVLQTVKDNPNITFPELEQVTKLEPVQIDGAVRRLEREGMLIKKEGEMTPGGLTPSSYRLTPKALAIPKAEANPAASPGERIHQIREEIQKIEGWQLDLLKDEKAKLASSLTPPENVSRFAHTEIDKTSLSPTTLATLRSWQDDIDSLSYAIVMYRTGRIER